jgi:hypothetical protein
MFSIVHARSCLFIMESLEFIFRFQRFCLGPTANFGKHLRLAGDLLYLSALNTVRSLEMHDKFIETSSIDPNPNRVCLLRILLDPHYRIKCDPQHRIKYDPQHRIKYDPQHRIKYDPQQRIKYDAWQRIKYDPLHRIKYLDQDKNWNIQNISVKP